MRSIWFALALLPACSCEEAGLPPGTIINRPDDPDTWLCRLGDERCWGENLHQTCVEDGEFLRTETEDCEQRVPTMICVDGLWCVVCNPGDVRCHENTVEHCSDDGMEWIPDEVCDRDAAEICHNGECVNECDVSVEEASYVGCEFWTADLDNASITVDEDASAQQFAVAVSNPGDWHTRVQVWVNDAPWGEPAVEEMIEEVVIPNGGLYVFELPRREIDGTPDGEFDWQGNASGSALTSRAFRITSTHRVVAYQHNPLDNRQVFSNDSSLLMPRSALDGHYVVLSWPQTIARTDNPQTNFCFDESDPNCDGLHSFMTVVATTDNTEVRVITKTRSMDVPQMPELDLRVNSWFTVTMNRYDVLNLESDGFNADFTGSAVEASAPVAVFTGSEASDVPFFDTISERLCCADHLEEQQIPLGALGTTYAATLSPARTPAVAAAGAEVAQVVEAEWFRVLAVEDCPPANSDDPVYTNVVTTLDAPYDSKPLAPCEVWTIRAEEDFVIESDNRVAVGQFVASQQVTGIPNNLPGGDPAFIELPPLQQWRDRYVFLVPDLYAFDFMTVIAPADARLFYDGGYMPPECVRTQLPTLNFEVYKCQLSFPIILDEIDPDTNRRAIEHVNQADGIHSLTADEPFGVILYGFDSFVSYGNAAGLNLDIIE